MEENPPPQKAPNKKVKPGLSYSPLDPLSAIGYSAEEGDIYYMSPPRDLSTYPMYIDNPKKVDKPVIGTYVAYTLTGTDITDQLTRRYSDFFNLYEKLLQRWPGIYVPRIPPKKITGNLDPAVVQTRMRLLNRFCLNLSKIEYLYNSEETNLFKTSKAPDIANKIKSLPELEYSTILKRMMEAFPDTNEGYDIVMGKNKFTEFDAFLRKSLKNIQDFQTTVNAAYEKREMEKKKYLELINGFSNYEKLNIMSYADNNSGALIFFNPSYSDLSEKKVKLSNEMINPFIAFKEWLEEEVLDVEAMSIAIKQLFYLMETEVKLKDRINSLEEGLKKGNSTNIFKQIFKKKEQNMADMEREKTIAQQKIISLQGILRIVGDYMENQIERFKSEKTQNYYKYLKMFAILQRESNKVIRELWTLVKNALNEISPNAGQDEEYQAQPMNEQQNQEQEQDGDAPEE